MKKILPILLAALFCFCTACTTAPEPQPTEAGLMQMGNPWLDHPTLTEAEAAVGFPYGLTKPLPQAGTPLIYRTLNGELLEVRYDLSGEELCIRKAPGEGQDISGDYTEYARTVTFDYMDGTVTTSKDAFDTVGRVLISRGGYSWALVAPAGCPAEVCDGFIEAVFGQ